MEPARGSQAGVFGAAGALTVLGTGLWYAWAIRSQGDSLTTPIPCLVGALAGAAPTLASFAAAASVD